MRLGEVTELREAFASAVAGAGRLDLARAALALARIGHPELDPAPSLARLDQLALAARPDVDAAGDPAGGLLAIARHLFSIDGFRGNADDYYDPRNSFLNDVLERRLGIPISLAVVLIEVGHRCGIAVEGVGFPGHFLVRAAGADGPVLLDPFFGRPVDLPELLARLEALSPPGRPPFTEVPSHFLAGASPPAILGRMLRNLLQVYRQRDEPERALAAVDLMLVLDPDGRDELRIRARLLEKLECWGAAAADLRRWLALAGNADDADRVRARVAELARLAPPTH